MNYGMGSIKKVINKKTGKPYKDRWEVRFHMSKGNDIDKIIRGSFADAKKYHETLVVLKRQGKVASSTLTFEDMCNEWNVMRQTSGEASPEVLKQERGKLAYVCKIIGKEKLSNIKLATIEKTLARIKIGDLRGNKALSNETVRKYYVLIKRVFEKAVAYDYIIKNPCIGAAVPTVQKPQRRALTTEEVIDFNEKLNAYEKEIIKDFSEKENRRAAFESNHPNSTRKAVMGLHIMSYIVAVKIDFATGMRRGEVLALGWNDINLREKTLSIEKTNIQDIGIKYATKTSASRRTLFLDAKTIEYLDSWKKRQEAILKSIGVPQTSDTPVCCNTTGQLINPSNLYHWWKKWVAVNGYQGFDFHGIRHTVTTHLLANGVDVSTVKKRLGHSKSSTTLDVYAHLLSESDKKAADVMTSIISKAQI